MTVQQVLRKLGQWSVRLKPDAPPGILSGLDYFGHVAIVAGRINPAERGDEMLSLARYVGVLRDVAAADAVTLSGVGMASWLGDEDGKGAVIEAPGVTLTGATFAASVAALLPASGAVTAGTLTTIAGTYSGTHVYQTPRTAIDYVCDLFGGDWRVNGNGTLDAGPASALFRTTPECIIARRDVAGYDMGTRALAGSLESERSAKDYTTRVVVVAEGLATGDADAPSVPYSDLHGNPVVMTRVVDEQDDTSATNASARAQMVLNLFSGPRRSVRLSVDDFDVAGDFEPGDVVWVWDPDAALVDTGNEVPFRGLLLNPAAVRVLSVSWPVTEGHTVGYRSGTGAWVDLTPWVDFEAPGGGQVEVADSLSSAITAGIGSIGTQVPGGGGDASVPGVPTFGTFSTVSYQPGDGLAQAQIKATWTQPLNTDSSTIVDGDHYEVRYRPSGGSEWQVTYVPWDQTSATIVGLSPSTTYEFQIRAVDYASPVNYGAWSATTSQLAASDTTAPGTPAPPTVAASLIAVQVTHTLGLASGGTYNLPLDMDHLEVHGDASSGFTPSNSTLLGKLQATGAMVTGSIPAVGTFTTSSTAAVFVKVVAVDKTGNRSSASSAASATASLIDSAHISDLVASKITAGTISAALLLSGSIKTGTSGARVESDSAGIRLYNSGGTAVVNLNATTGAATYAGALSAATGTFAGSLSAATGTFSGSLSAATGSFSGTISGSTITGSTLQTAASGARVQVGAGSGLGYINFYDASGNSGYLKAGNTGGTNELGLYNGGGQTYVLTNDSTATLNSSLGVVSANSSGWALAMKGGNTANVSGSGNTLTLTSGANTNITASGNVFISASGNQVNCGSSSSDQVYSTGIYNSTSTFAANIGIATSPLARLYRLTSSARYKVEIETADVPDEAIRALRAVTYYDRGQAEQNGGTEGLSQQAGLIAEEVHASPLGPLLVELDDGGQPESVNYERVGVTLVPVVQRLLDRVGQLERRLAELEKD